MHKKNFRWMPVAKMIVAAILTLVVVVVAYIIVVFVIYFSGNQPQEMGSAWSNFDVSPRGDSIVFSAEGDRTKNLFLLNLKSHVVSRLTDSSHYENYPAFSPDGKYIVFSREKVLGSPGYLYVMNISTGITRQITGRSTSCDEYPRYSRDGDEIVFERDSDRFATREEDCWRYPYLYTVRPDGSDLRKVTCFSYLYNLYPSMHSADGEIVFESQHINSDYEYDPQLSEIGANGSCSSRTATLTGYNGDLPYLFADGRHLLYTADRDGKCHYDLYEADLQKRGQARCLNAIKCGEDIGRSAVTADGEHVFFVVDFELPELWEINIDGTHAHRIADDTLFTDPMHWKWTPDQDIVPK